MKIDIARPYPGSQPLFMIGDRRTYGTVYVGTQNGIFYGQKGTALPYSPTGLVATPGSSRVTLSWTASSGATSYKVLRSTSDTSGYTTIASPTTTSYTDTGLISGTTYYYAIKAANTGGQSAGSIIRSARPL